MQTGFFIVFEGIDGSGKTTQTQAVTDYLNSRNIPTFGTCEPTSGTEIGALLRKHLANPNSIPSVDALLFAADRVSHYLNQIKPKLQKGINIICDRYVFSSLVYQGHQNLDLKWLKKINEQAPLPQLVIYIEIPPKIALSRINKQKRNVKEKFEYLQILEKIDKRYKDVLDNTTYQFVNGNQSVDKVTTSICKIIESKLYFF